MAAGPGTTDTTKLYMALRRAGLRHPFAMDRLWLAFGTDAALLSLDKLAIAVEFEGEKCVDEVTRLMWPVDAVALAEAIGLEAEDLDGVVHDMAEADAADPDDEDAIEGMHELAAGANNDGLPAQFRFLLQRDASLPKAITDAVAESDKSLDLALARRLGDSEVTPYVRGGLVTESYDPEGRSILVDFNRGTAFVYQVRRPPRRPRSLRRYEAHDTHYVERVIYALDIPRVERQVFPAEVASLLPLCKKAWELQIRSSDRLLSFWAMRRALDFAVNGLLHSLSSGTVAALGADENRAYLQPGLALSEGSLFLEAP